MERRKSSVCKRDMNSGEEVGGGGGEDGEIGKKESKQGTGCVCTVTRAVDKLLQQFREYIWSEHAFTVQFYTVQFVFY